MTNLVINAINFTTEGAVSINCCVESQSNKTYQIVFSVTDNGPGISSDAKGKLFNNYEVYAEGTERKSCETGLALTTSKNIIDSIGAK